MKKLLFCLQVILLSFVFLSFAPDAQAELGPYQCGNLQETCGTEVCPLNFYCEHTKTLFSGTLKKCVSAPAGFCEYEEIQKNVAKPYDCGNGYGDVGSCGADVSPSSMSLCPQGYECKKIYWNGPFYCAPTNQCAQYLPEDQVIPTPTATPTPVVAGEGCGNLEDTPGGKRCIVNGVAALSYTSCANPWPGQECCTSQVLCPQITQAPTPTAAPTATLAPTLPAATPLPPTPTVTPFGEAVGGGGGGSLAENVKSPILNPLEGPSNEDFDALNPLSGSAFQEQLSTPGGIIGRVLAFAFPIGGVALFLMLVWAGFEILVNSADKNAVSAGKQRATAAIVGYILLFCAYWLMQIVEFVFGIHIL